MYARLELIGNATADPIVKAVTVRGEQRSVTEFSLAVNDPFNKEKAPSFFNNLAAWNGTGKLVAEHVKKGDRVFVTADIEIRSDEKDGVKRNHNNYTVREVRLISSRPSGEGRYESAPPAEPVQADVPVAEPVAEAPVEQQTQLATTAPEVPF